MKFALCGLAGEINAALSVVSVDSSAEGREEIGIEGSGALAMPAQDINLDISDISGTGVNATWPDYITSAPYVSLNITAFADCEIGMKFASGFTPQLPRNLDAENEQSDLLEKQKEWLGGVRKIVHNDRLVHLTRMDLFVPANIMGRSRVRGAKQRAIENVHTAVLTAATATSAKSLEGQKSFASLKQQT